MSIKPVLVPDHDAVSLRGLMDRFADASTGPTRQQLAESRAAVAAAQGVAEGYSLKKTNVNKYMEPGDPDEYTQDINIKDTDYEIINNKTGQVVGTASWTTNDYFGPGALKITMKNGATRWLDIWEREKGNPQTAFNRFVKDPKTAKKYKEQGVAEQQVDELSVHKMLKYSDAAEKDRDALNQKWDNRTASEKEKERVLRHEKGEQRAADKIKQKTGKLPVQIGKLDRLKHAITREGVAEGIMDTVKQTFNDCVVGYPMGTSDEQFIQGWARAIQAETGRDIPLEKLTQLYQDYVERSDELMQSHGTTNESEHNHDHDDEGETCPECDGAGCPECYGDEDRDRAHDHAQGLREAKKRNVIKLHDRLVDLDDIGFDGNEYGKPYVSSARYDNGQRLHTGELSDLNDLYPNFYSEMEQGLLPVMSGTIPQVVLKRKTRESTDLSEFAPSDSGDGGGDDDGFDEDTLRKLAAQWFNGDEDPQVERLLAAAGWEIGQDEGYDDEPGVFVVLSGDADGRSYMSWPAEELRSDVAEAQPDVMRHRGDTTVRVVKKGGKPIGEIGIDSEASAGNGPYYVKLYDGSYDAVGFDTAEEALAELKYAIKSAGSGPDTSFGGPGGWTGPVKEQQVDELSPKTLGSYIKKSSADAATRQGEVSGRNQFGKGAEFAVKAFYGDRIQPHPTRTDPRIAKRQAGVDQAVDRLTAEDVAEGIDPVEQLRADIRRFAL